MEDDCDSTGSHGNKSCSSSLKVAITAGEGEEVEEEHLLTAEDGLSSEVFALLQQFQQMQDHHDCHDHHDGHDASYYTESNKDEIAEMSDTNTANCNNNNDRNDRNDTNSKDATDNSTVIAATMRRLQRQQGELAAQHERILSDRVVVDLVSSSSSLAQVLDQEGVVRINGVLTDNMCDECLELINAQLAGSDKETTKRFDTETEEQTFNLQGFGNVFSRKNRYDMFLRNEGVLELALASMLQDGSILGDLFSALLEGLTGNFHEFSSLISDPTSASQSIHPDSRYTEHAPIWTVFVALQDIDNDMGPTIFLPRTNTLACHEMLEKSPCDKEQLLSTCQYRRSSLQKGDCAIMDSRLFHFGAANESQTRRVLLYFTIQNPKHVGEYPTGGSLFPELIMTTQDYAAIRI